MSDDHDFDVQYGNNLRAWREFRRMTQEELAAAMEPPTTGAVVSLLENGDRRLAPKWLRRIAPALGTTPGFLLDHRPEDLPRDMMEVLNRIPLDRRKQAIAILETFTERTGTEG